MVQTVICCGPGCFAPGIKEASPQLYYKIYKFRMVNIIGAKRGQDAIAISAKKQQEAIAISAKKQQESMELVPLVRSARTFLQTFFVSTELYQRREETKKIGGHTV